MTTEPDAPDRPDAGHDVLDEIPDGIVEGQSPRWLRWVEPLLGGLLLTAAIWVLGRELHTVRAVDVARAAGGLPRWQLGLAVVATVLNYAIMTGYDHLALRQLGRSLRTWQVTVSGFAAFAVVNSLGFALITGPWARLRFYARWGVDLGVLPQVVAFNAVTVWTGLFALLGSVLAIRPEPSLGAWAPLPVWRLIGALMVASVGLYIYVAATMRHPIRVWRWTLHMPDARLAWSQVALSTTDWFLVAGVLWLLLPDGSLPFGELLAAFLAAQLLGLVSHVPGSLGVFEGTMLTLLHGEMPAHALVAGLLLFRIIFYLIPLLIALVAVAAGTWPGRPAARG